MVDRKGGLRYIKPMSQKSGFLKKPNLISRLLCVQSKGSFREFGLDIRVDFDLKVDVNSPLFKKIF